MVFVERKWREGVARHGGGLECSCVCPRPATDLWVLAHSAAKAQAEPRPQLRLLLSMRSPRRQRERGDSSRGRRRRVGQQRWEAGGERMSEEGEEGGGIWKKVCWAVRISPQHAQRNAQQPAAPSDRQQPAAPSNSKQRQAGHSKRRPATASDDQQRQAADVGGRNGLTGTGHRAAG